MQQNKQPLITYGYHFLCEAIILFLICLPIMFYHYSFVPYGSYIVYSFGICLLFSLFAKLGNSYLPFVIFAPVMMIVFYVSGYPILLSLAIPALLTWRYINIRGDTFLSRENGYIRITVLLATGLFLLINDSEIILYALLQFLIMLIGYISGHLTVIEKAERKRFDKNLWLVIGSILVAGTVIIFMLFDTGRYVFLKVGEGLSYIAALFVSKIGFLFDSLDLSKIFLGLPSSPMEQQEEQLAKQEFGGEPSLVEKIMPYVYWGIAILIVCFVIVVVFRILKKRFVIAVQEGISEAVSYGELDTGIKGNRKFRETVFSRYFNKPNHPVRKLVFQFEEDAAKLGFERYPFETIEEWLNRLDFGADLAIYQKVRYGKGEVNDGELALLKHQLEEIEARFEHK